ncbi:hypothetical protein ACFOWB_02630 [Chenggangzhangella methanolivorans]|uniref:hypothetical protein n=1 Tax=Chenggangzhangella methanolivorans TaxID=1437009 RepID=UPI003619658B
MSLVVENPVLAKEVGELAAGDVCLVRFSGETLVAFAAALPSGELKMVRFAGSKEKAPLKMSGWDDANSVEVMCLPDVVIRPNVDSLVPHHQGNNPIGGLVITPSGLSAVVYPGDANRYYLDFATGRLDPERRESLPHFKTWTVSVPNGTERGHVLKVVSV